MPVVRKPRKGHRTREHHLHGRERRLHRALVVVDQKGLWSPDRRDDLRTAIVEIRVEPSLEPAELDAFQMESDVGQQPVPPDQPVGNDVDKGPALLGHRDARDLVGDCGDLGIGRLSACTLVDDGS